MKIRCAVVSVEPRIFANMFDGNDRLDLPAADLGRGYFPEGIPVVIAEDVFGRGGEH
jgi:hypothetical protein